MARHADGLKINAEEEIFGVNGDKTAIIPMDDGFDASYETSNYPKRETFNEALARLGSIGYDVNRFGALLPWDASLIYEQNAWVTGSDGGIYRSEVAGNINQDPTAVDGGNNPIYIPSKWLDLNAVLLIPQLKIERKSVSVSSHTSGVLLKQTDENIKHTYSIEGFRGSEISTDEKASDIRGVWIRYHYFYNESVNAHRPYGLKASFPWDYLTTVDIAVFSTTDADGNAREQYFGRVFVPVDKGQISISVENLVSSLSETLIQEFEIVGVEIATTA